MYKHTQRQLFYRVVMGIVEREGAVKKKKCQLTCICISFSIVNVYAASFESLL